MLRLDVNLEAAFGALDGVQQAAAEAVRPAAQAAAQVFYDEVRARVGTLGPVTGNLLSSIYQVYSKDNSTDGRRATYHVSWNAKKAPHGHLVEYGHIQTRVQVLTRRGTWITTKARLATPRRVAARPFIRPSFDAVHQIAAARARDVFLERIKERLP